MAAVIDGRPGQLMEEAASEIKRLQEELDEWRFTNKVDELGRELERTLKALRHCNEQVRMLVEALDAVMYWDNGKPEWADARAVLATVKGEQQ
jgi:hypothetical protein